MNKIFFFGSSDYSIKVFENLDPNLLNNFDIKYFTNNIESKKFDSKIYKKDKNYTCDLLLSVGFSEKILINNIKSAYGLFNIHQSLLPEYRGRHPVQAMIINGEKTYGCTLHHLDKNFDTGNIVKTLSIKYANIPNEITVRKLIVQKSIELAEYLLNNYQHGSIKSLKQNKKPNFLAPERKPDDSQITGKLDFVTIKNMTKALMGDNYRPFIIEDNKKIYIKNVFNYNLKNRNLIKFKAMGKVVYLEKY
ncbi:formyltransferase family protein [Acidimicrobiia bacterium]|nr:formyltransferase family protein [Acidimicrobiia bacterium]